MYIYICMYICIYVYLHIRIFRIECMHICIYAYYMYICRYAYTHICIYAYMHTYMQVESRRHVRIVCERALYARARRGNVL